MQVPRRGHLPPLPPPPLAVFTNRPFVLGNLEPGQQVTADSPLLALLLIHQLNRVVALQEEWIAYLLEQLPTVQRQLDAAAVAALQPAEDQAAGQPAPPKRRRLDEDEDA